MAWDTTWFTMGGWELRFGVLIDGPARLLLFVVAFVGFLIHIFSLGYMENDPARPRYFGGLSIFMFSMLGITLADNLIMIFVFWELVGFSSYLLIAIISTLKKLLKPHVRHLLLTGWGTLVF